MKTMIRGRKSCKNCFWENNCPDAGNGCADYYNPASTAQMEAEYRSDMELRIKQDESDIFLDIDNLNHTMPEV